MPRGTPTGAAVTTVVSLALLLVVPVAAGFGTANVPPGLASYNTGRVAVILPQALPSVELFQDANNSVRAALGVQEVLELAPGALPHPRVVAAAFPEDVDGFNGTAVSNSTGWPLNLTATLAVHVQNTTLWAPTPSLAPVGGQMGTATLSVGYAPLDNGSAGAGVSMAWQISDWPWVSHSDLLAVEFQLTVSPAASLRICSGGGPVGLALSPCSGPNLTGAALISWGSTYNGLEGAGTAGPVAALSWNSSAPGTSAPYSVGAFADGNGTAQIVLGAAAHGSPSVTGSVGFALVAPLLPVVGPLAANPAAYAAGLGLAAAGALGGIVAYRRRERRIREQL